MKTAGLALLAFFALASMSGCAQRAEANLATAPDPRTLPVEWLGCPVYAHDRGTVAADADIAVGLRADGVVVWKRIRNFNESKGEPAR